MKKRLWKHFARRTLGFFLIVIVGLAVVVALYMHEHGEWTTATAREALECVTAHC